MSELADVAQRWSAERVLALAPDVASGRAARGLTPARGWSDEGTDEDTLVWGRRKGSAAAPYHVIADVSGPEYHCSCPSRKVPCKHVLGLLLRWAGGQVGPAPEPDWVRDWSAGRAARAARREAAAAKPREANPKTAARRGERIAAGLAELDRWLADRVRTGVAGLTTAGYAPFDDLAARLVDAQATGAAGLVRRLAATAVTGSPDRLVTELGLLRLLVAGYQRLDELPEPMAATVLSRVGVPVSTESVLTTPPVPDLWAVLGVRDEILDERLSTRRVWLRGCGTGRMALVLSFAGPGQALAGEFVTGTTIEADLCFYPGAAPLRALVAGRAGVVHDAVPPADPVDAALDSWASALAGDPWLDRWPLLLEAVVPTPTHVVEPATGTALPLVGEDWRLIGAAGGRPCRVLGEYGPGGLRPVTAWVDDRVVVL